MALSCIVHALRKIVLLLRFSITCGLSNSKVGRRMCFSLPSIKCSVGPPSLRLLPSTVSLSNGAQRFDYRALGSSRKLGAAAEHLNWLMVARNAFLGWSLNFRVRILLKGAVTRFCCWWYALFLGMKYLSCCWILLQEPDESASSYEQWKSGYAIWGHWLSGEFSTSRRKWPTNLALQKYGFTKIIKILNGDLLWHIALSFWIELKFGSARFCWGTKTGEPTKKTL